MADVSDAARALDARKDALLAGDAPGVLEPDEFRLMWAGLEIDYDDAQKVAERAAEVAAANMHGRRAHPMQILAGLWADGLATGVLLADMRAREESGEADRAAGRLREAVAAYFSGRYPVGEIADRAQAEAALVEAARAAFPEAGP